MADKKVGEYHQEDDKTCMQNVADQWHGFTSFMWDPEHKAVMGRNARSWAEIGVFYLFFYAFLAGFFAAMFSVFYIGFISHEEPTYTDKLGTPGLAHRPKYSNEENIAFNMDNPNTYNKFVDDIVKLLDDYKDQNSTLYEDCPSGHTSEDQFGRLCQFDVSELGTVCTTPKFGYEQGEPCVYMYLNKVWGWQPKAYENSSLSEELQAIYDPNRVMIECKGKKDRDKDNIGEIDYYPQGGIDFKYFPYVGTADENSDYRTNYLQPVMAVHFKNLTMDTTVRVECWARAKNMEYGEYEGHTEFMLRVNTAPLKSEVVIGDEGS